VTRYYLHLEGVEQGPYTIYQLKAMWMTGGITLETLYRMDDDGNWFSLSMIVDTLEKKDSDISRLPASVVPANREVAITDIDMKFQSMVWFMVKLAIASIPASMILGVIFAVFYVVVAAISGGIVSKLIQH